MDGVAFRSGRWLGWYRQDGKEHRQEIDLSFDEGSMTGIGHDEIGPFVIAGSYESDELTLHWLKTYVGRHTVIYSGLLRDPGIVGTWIIPAERGGLFGRRLLTDPLTDVFELTFVGERGMRAS